jgi:hypothetical protein
LHESIPELPAPTTDVMFAAASAFMPLFRAAEVEEVARLICMIAGF